MIVTDDRKYPHLVIETIAPFPIQKPLRSYRSQSPQERVDLLQATLKTIVNRFLVIVYKNSDRKHPHNNLNLDLSVIWIDTGEDLN